MIVRQTFSVGRPIKSDQTDGLSQLFELETRDGEALSYKRVPIELEAIRIQIQVFSPPYDIKPVLQVILCCPGHRMDYVKHSEPIQILGTS